MQIIAASIHGKAAAGSSAAVPLCQGDFIFNKAGNEPAVAELQTGRGEFGSSAALSVKVLGAWLIGQEHQG